MNNLLRPKKNSWPHIAISIAVVEIYWLLSCYYMTHFDAAKSSTLANVVFFVVEMAGVYFAVLFGTWYCKVEISMKENRDSYTPRA